MKVAPRARVATYSGGTCTARCEGCAISGPGPDTKVAPEARRWTIIGGICAEVCDGSDFLAPEPKSQNVLSKRIKKNG